MRYEYTILHRPNSKTHPINVQCVDVAATNRKEGLCLGGYRALIYDECFGIAEVPPRARRDAGRRTY